MRRRSSFNKHVIIWKNLQIQKVLTDLRKRMSGDAISVVAILKKFAKEKQNQTTWRLMKSYQNNLNKFEIWVFQSCKHSKLNFAYEEIGNCINKD